MAVNYNSPIETIDFVVSLSRLKDCDSLQVMIIENSNKDQRDTDLAANCRQYLRDLIIVETPWNHNYFGSVNYGLRSHGLDPVDFEYFIISNVDILFNDFSILCKLLSLELKNVGIIAPSVVSTAKGVDQNPYMTKRIKWILFYYYLLIRQNVFFTTVHEKLTDYLRSKKANKFTNKPLATEIYAPHGAFIIFTQLYFKSQCSIDFGLNLFGEEIFVAEECRRKNLIVCYRPEISVLHTEHVSTGAVPSRFIVAKKRQSVIYFLKNYK